ncbi:MAG: hypothetical protein IKI40_03115 [Treponema sp.]|nr:hypothetical protein [Treponema sp.]
MKFRFSLFFSLVVFLVLCGFLYGLRSIPVAKIWNNYSVAYVNNSVSEDLVVFYLENEGCQDIISLSRQVVPFVSSISPVASYDSEYLDQRLKYFSDESSAYRLFYIPEKYQDNASRAIARLSRELSVEAGVDSVERYPWLVPLICLAAYLLLFFASKYRSVFALPALFPLLLSLSQPFYSVAAGVCLMLLAVYLINGLWTRRKFISAVFRSLYIDILVVASLMIMLAVSPTVFLLALGVCATAACAFVFLGALHEYNEYKLSFTYIPIFSAWQIPVIYRKTAKYLVGTCLPILALLIMFLISTTTTPAASIQGIAVPSPSDGTIPNASTYSLPNMNSFYSWAWKQISYPYRTLNDLSEVKDPKDGDSVNVAHYTNTDEGIVVTEEPVLTYNDEFRKKVKEENMTPVSVEKLLASQDDDVVVKYSSGIKSKSDSQHNGINLALLLTALIIPLALFAAYLGLGRKKYENSK